VLSVICWTSSVITKRDWEKYLENQKELKKKKLLVEIEDKLDEINEILKR